MDFRDDCDLCRDECQDTFTHESEHLHLEWEILKREVVKVIENDIEKIKNFLRRKA